MDIRYQVKYVPKHKWQVTTAGAEGIGSGRAREVAEARLLWEQRARLAVRLGHHGLGKIDLPKADLELLVQIRVDVHPRVVLGLGSHLDICRLI